MRLFSRATSCLAVITLMSILCGFGAAQSERPTRLVILGTGTPNPDPERSGTALAVVSGGNAYLVDAGPGVVRRAEAARRAGVDALTQPNLKTAFITHLHSDHTVGLPDLIFSPWVLEREAPLTLYGPDGIEAMASHLLAAYDQDIRQRLSGLEPANEEGYKVESHVIKPGRVFQDAQVVVDAIPVLHGSWKHAFGFKFTVGDRTIVISGDARPSPALVEAARGADILAHEVYSVEGFKTRPPVWQRYHASFHTSTHELAEIAKVTKPKLLVLYHQLYWGVNDADLVAEIRAAGYKGDVVSASDLDVY